MFAKGAKVGSKQWKAERVEYRSIGCQMKECRHIRSQRMPSQIGAVNVGSEHCHGAFNVGSVFSQEWWNSGAINSYVGIGMVEHRNQNTSMNLDVLNEALRILLQQCPCLGLSWRVSYFEYRVSNRMAHTPRTMDRWWVSCQCQHINDQFRSS